MAYKQDRNPGKINYGPSGYRDPKRTTKNYNALEFNMPDLSNIVDKKADGEQVTEDKSNKSGSKEEGVIKKGENVKSITAETTDKVKNAQRVQDFIDEGSSLKGERKKGRQTKRGINKAIRQFKRDDKKRGLSEERKNMLDAAVKERDRLRGEEAFDKQSSDKMVKKGNRQTDRQIKRANKKIDHQQEMEDDIASLNPTKKLDPLVSEKDQKEYEEDLINIRRGNNNNNNKESFYPEGIGPGPDMYKQQNMRPKNLFKQGKSMPNIDSEETRPAMYNQGRPMNSGMLENNPNIVQPDNKVAFSTQQRNDKFTDIASAGMPDQTADGMGQINPANTPNKPMGGLDQTFNQNQMAMYGMPKMYDGPEFNSGLRKASADGKLDDNPNFKSAVDSAPASHYHVSKGKYANDTRVNKSNYKATERDDAAHIEYLKKDIDYDSKHNKSDIDMTADEKHISKLAGDMKYDKKKHGDGPSYGRHGAAWNKKKSSGTTKRGAAVSLTTRKAVDGKETDLASDNTTMNFNKPSRRPTPDTPNTVTYSKTNKKGKTKTKTVKGGTGASKRLSKKFARKVNKGTRNKAEYDQPGSFKKVASKIAKKQGISNKAASAILADSTRKASASARLKNKKLNKVK